MASSTKDEHINGCDFLTMVAGSTITPDGTIVYNFYVSPTTISARLGQIGRLWERYQFTKLRFVYVPCVPTSTAGQLTFAYDPDSTDVTPTAFTRESLYALDDNVTTSVYAPSALPIKNLDLHTLYYTGANGIAGDERLELQGQLYVAYSGATPGAPVVFGSLMLEYDVHFSKRCYEPPVPLSAGIPLDTSKFTGATVDVLGAATTGLFAGLKAAGVDLSAGTLPLTSQGFAVTPKAGPYHFDLTTAFEALGVAGSWAELKMMPVLKNAVGTIVAYLAWSVGKTLVGKFTTHSLEAGDVANGVSLTTLTEETTAGTNVDYWRGGVAIENNTASVLYLDLIFDVLAAEAEVTHLYARGLTVQAPPTDVYLAVFEDSHNRVTTSGNFVMRPGCSPQPIVTSRSCMPPDLGGGSSIASDPVLTKGEWVFPAPSPTAAMPTTVGRGAAAAATATPSAPVRR